jgi:hypothetical protein
MASSWKDDSSRTTTSTSAPESGNSESGVPRFPPTKACRSLWKRVPASAVVVLFPFVPVMATTGTSPRKREASSTSPSTGMPARRAAPISGRESGTPGETTTRSQPVKSLSVWPPRAKETWAFPSAWTTGASSVAVRRSVTVTRAPSRAQRRAAAAPLRARPTTRTFFPVRSMAIFLS